MLHAENIIEAVTQGDSMLDSALLLKAAAFAATHHRDQRRKGATAAPYVNHCLEVARLLAEVGGVTAIEVLCAALLHDVVEDTSVTLDEVRSIFGDAIAHIVGEVTDDKSLVKAERKRLQVVNAPHKSDGAKMLKLADKSSNVHDLVIEPPKSWSAARIKAYGDWAEQVAAGIRGVNPALEAHFDAELAQLRAVQSDDA